MRCYNSPSFLLVLFFICATSFAYSDDGHNPPEWTYTQFTSLNEDLGVGPDTTYHLGHYLLKIVKRVNIHSDIVLGKGVVPGSRTVSQSIMSIELIDLRTDSIYEFSVDGDSPELIATKHYASAVDKGGFDVLLFRELPGRIKPYQYNFTSKQDTIPHQIILKLTNGSNDDMDFFIDNSMDTPFNLSLKDDQGVALNGALKKIYVKAPTGEIHLHCNFDYIPGIPEDKKSLIHELSRIIIQRKF